MRAIKLWQDDTGETLTWPDHPDLCIWLLDEMKEIEVMVRGFSWTLPMYDDSYINEATDDAATSVLKQVADAIKDRMEES